MGVYHTGRANSSFGKTIGMYNRRTCLCRSLKKGRVRRRVASILYGLLIISIPAQFLVDLDPEKPCAVDAGDEDGGIAGGGSP